MPSIVPAATKPKPQTEYIVKVARVEFPEVVGMFWKQGLGVVGRIGHGTVPDFDARWVKHPIVLIALPFRSDRVTQSFRSWWRRWCGSFRAAIS
ncbi:MAG: hypothetical protein CM15mP18_5230 [Methanobacteriota archaeon]|nr:MAG: hypothetical protein CM15mP18_5230 [Euryarchaeota archaeon]